MSLTGQVCLVTGASRGIGKGIALQLGEAGATVYITGRPSQESPEKPGKALQETADELTARGGRGIPVPCDHKKDEQIIALFSKIKTESGRLDILVNNASSSTELTMEETKHKRKYWECAREPGDVWDEFNVVGLRNYYQCAVYATKMMVERNSGLIINISSAGGLAYLIGVAYGCGKVAADRMAADMAQELVDTNITAVSFWPGAVRTETIQKTILAATGEDADPAVQKIFKEGESPEFVGRAVVALANDKDRKKKSGKICIVADLAQEYGFTDINGSQPRSMRQLSYALGMAGYHRTASWIPQWLKFPGFLLHAAGNKF